MKTVTLTTNGTLYQSPGTYVWVSDFKVYICGKCGHEYWLPTVFDARFAPRHQCPSAGRTQS